jgi:hypothetical protein
MSEINQCRTENTGTEKVLEAIYNESPTRLFVAIEEMNWDDACDIIEEDPVQVRTWIRSKGTENTTFDWSVWRRLPIHEVRIEAQLMFDCRFLCQIHRVSPTHDLFSIYPYLIGM